MYVTIAVLAASRLSSNIKRHLKCYVCDQNNTRLLTFKQYKKAFEMLCVTKTILAPWPRKRDIDKIRTKSVLEIIICHYFPIKGTTTVGRSLCFVSQRSRGGQYTKDSLCIVSPIFLITTYSNYYSLNVGWKSALFCKNNF